MKRSILGFVTLCLVFCLTAGARFETKLAKQALGGDSLSTAVDTTTAILIPIDAKKVYIKLAVSDSTTWTTQLSPNNTNWFTKTALDTVDSATVAVVDSIDTGELPTEGGWYVRVILDNIGAAHQAYGRAFFIVEK